MLAAKPAARFAVRQAFLPHIQNSEAMMGEGVSWSFSAASAQFS